MQVRVPAGPGGTCAANNQELMQVTVPAGIVTGQSFQCTTPGGQQFQITVPEGSGPGSTMQVRVPAGPGAFAATAPRDVVSHDKTYIRTRSLSMHGDDNAAWSQSEGKSIVEV
jgi:hypothetical protein